MGQRMTAVAWLERDYGTLFASGEEIVSPVMALFGLRITKYSPDPAQDRPGPMISFKRDDVDPQPCWPDAAFWPEPHPDDDLDVWQDW